MTEWTPEEERVANWFSDHWWDGCEVKSGGGRIAACTGPCACREAARDVLAIAAMQPRWRDVKTDPPPMDDWQPIETAPRDGRRFLTWCKTYGVRVGMAYRRSDHDDWLSNLDAYGNSSKGGMRATHWMPLPGAPNEN